MTGLTDPVQWTEVPGSVVNSAAQPPAPSRWPGLERFETSPGDSNGELEW